MKHRFRKAARACCSSEKPADCHASTTTVMTVAGMNCGQGEHTQKKTRAHAHTKEEKTQTHSQVKGRRGREEERKRRARGAP